MKRNRKYDTKERNGEESKERQKKIESKKEIKE